MAVVVVEAQEVRLRLAQGVLEAVVLVEVVLVLLHQLLEQQTQAVVVAVALIVRVLVAQAVAVS
jgi:hypothetical protein